MSFFSKKQEVGLEEFCRDFYDNMILHPVIGGGDASAVYPDYVKNFITEADNVFADVDSRKLADELIILRFELFALAWLHKFRDRSAVTQSIFTRKYLHEKKRDDIWDAMEHYNQAIAHSVTIGPINTTKDPINKITKAIGVGSISFIYRVRADLYDDYCKKGFDSKCVARVLNRMFAENAWKKKITSYLLILALCHRLGLGSGADYLGPNEKAQLHLQVFIRGLYDGAQQSWDNKKIKV